MTLRRPDGFKAVLIRKLGALDQEAIFILGYCLVVAGKVEQAKGHGLVHQRALWGDGTPGLLVALDDHLKAPRQRPEQLQD